MVPGDVGGIRFFAEESYSNPGIVAGDGCVERCFAFGIFRVKIYVVWEKIEDMMKSPRQAAMEMGISPLLEQTGGGSTVLQE